MSDILFKRPIRAKNCINTDESSIAEENKIVPAMILEDMKIKKFPVNAKKIAKKLKIDIS